MSPNYHAMAWQLQTPRTKSKRKYEEGLQDEKDSYALAFMVRATHDRYSVHSLGGMGAGRSAWTRPACRSGYRSDTVLFWWSHHRRTGCREALVQTQRRSRLRR